jgi:D-glycero-D-manno-heptose 1,7-bisphosphate phosphatase
MLRQYRRSILLDRDGVINAKLPENSYVTRASEFYFLPGVFDALPILISLGFILVVVTNQRGIARRKMSHGDLQEIHLFMKNQLRTHGTELNHIYYCPHETYELCPCRKPRPGMLLKAARDLALHLPMSYMVGDSPSDVAAGHNATARTVRIAKEPDRSAHLTFPSLLDFALFLQSVHGA